MRAWLVAGAVIEGPAGILLVCNRRRNGDHDWTPPGGVIDDGEDVLGGLTREVLEETGLMVSRWAGPLYEITAAAPGLGWRLRVEAYRAVEVAGALAPADPDGIVVEARYVAAGDCAPALAGGHPWVAEPLLAWLGERWEGSRHFRYHVEGTDLRSLTITRA